ncbi:hypothetical protein, partial [Corynebacterium sp.]|uniref:hypothetical protein n=1 Tax=Corynebacterium sp. TaxID=1720 RepID=UPI0028ACEF9C
YPEDIHQAAPSPTAGQKRAGLISGIVFVIVLFSSITGVVWAWGAQHAEASFLELALMTFVLSVMFALFDLVIIDWLIICTWRPKAMVYPGTEDCAGWRDYGFTSKNYCSPKRCSSWWEQAQSWTLSVVADLKHLPAISN